jgi:hypothetical protein
MKYQLFKPKDGGIKLKDEYPELGEIPEFRNLSEDELLFCYEMGCPTSKSSSEENLRIKISKAISYSFGNNISDKDKTKYLNGNIPESVRIATERFKQFRPSARMRAKIMVDNVFDNFESIVNPDSEFLVAMKNDIDLQNKYVANSIKVIDALKNLVTMKETGFGITVSGNAAEDTKDGEPTLLDRAAQ